MEIFFFYAKDSRPDNNGELSWFATIERADEVRILKELAGFMRPLLFAGSAEIDDSWVNDHWGAEIESYGYACLNSMHVPGSVRVAVAQQQLASSRSHIPEARRKA